MTYILLKLVFVCWFEVRATNWGFESQKSIRREEVDEEKDEDDIKQRSFVVKEGGKLFNNSSSQNAVSSFHYQSIY